MNKTGFPEDWVFSEDTSEEFIENEVKQWFSNNRERLKFLLTEEEVERFQNVFMPQFEIEVNEAAVYDEGNVTFEVFLNEVVMESESTRTISGTSTLKKEGPFASLPPGDPRRIMPMVYSKLSSEDKQFVNKRVWQMKARTIDPNATEIDINLFDTPQRYYTRRLMRVTNEALQKTKKTVTIRRSYPKQTLIRDVLENIGFLEDEDSVFMTHVNDPIIILPVGPYFDVNSPMDRYPEFFPEKSKGKLAQMKVYRHSFFTDLTLYEKYPWLAEFTRDLEEGKPLYRNSEIFNQGFAPLLTLDKNHYVHVQRDIGVLPIGDIEFMVDVYDEEGFDPSRRRVEKNKNRVIGQDDQAAYNLYFQVTGGNPPSKPEGVTDDVIPPASYPGVGWVKQQTDEGGSVIYFGVLFDAQQNEVDDLNSIIPNSEPVFRFAQSSFIPPILDEQWLIYFKYWLMINTRLLIVPHFHGREDVNRDGYRMMIDAAAHAFRLQDARTKQLLEFICRMAEEEDWTPLFKRFLNSSNVVFQPETREEYLTRSMLSPEMNECMGRLKNVAKQLFSETIALSLKNDNRLYLCIFTDPNTPVPEKSRPSFSYDHYDQPIVPTTYFEYIVLLETFDFSKLGNWVGRSWPMVNGLPFLGNLTSRDRITFFTGRFSEFYMDDEESLSALLAEIIRRKNKDLVIYIDSAFPDFFKKPSLRQVLESLPRGAPDGFKEWMEVFLDGNPMQIESQLKNMTGETKQFFIESLLKKKKISPSAELVETVVKNNPEKAMELATLNFGKIEHKGVRNLAVSTFFDKQREKQCKFVNPTLLELIRSTTKIGDDRWEDVGTHFVLALLPPPESVKKTVRKNLSTAILTTISRVGDGKGRDKKVAKRDVDEDALVERIRSGEWKFDINTFDEITYLPVEKFSEGGKNMLQHAMDSRMSTLVPILIAMGRIEFTAEEFLSWKYMEIFIYGIMLAKDYASLSKKTIEKKRVKKAVKNILYELIDSRDFTSQ